MSDFHQYDLPDALLYSLKQLGIISPTPIQSRALPLALEGRDILGSAKTGTGKTFAFAIPVLERLMLDPKASALVLSPTRELATQLMQAFKSLMTPKSKIHGALLIGGDPIEKQCRHLKRGARLLVGTPGRINDHFTRGMLNLKKINCLVLDETDQMLDMGFKPQIDQIVRHLPKTRQTLLFSATFPNNIIQLSKAYLKDPARISVGGPVEPVTKIKQDVLHLRESEKYQHLLEHLDQCKGAVLVFVKTKHAAERMSHRLSQAGHSVDAIHGDLRQNKRERVMKAFRNQTFRILVATNIAARGLDIPHIKLVVNYDLPQCRDDYIHRVGRTARAGAEGSALSFVTPSESRLWKVLQGISAPRQQRSSHQHSKKAKPQHRKKHQSFDFKKSRSKHPNSKKPNKVGSKRSFKKAAIA